MRLPAPCLVVLIGPSGSGKTAWAAARFRAGQVISSDALCSEDVGALVRVPVNDVRAQKELNPAADDPAYQPFTLGG